MNRVKAVSLVLLMIAGFSLAAAFGQGEGATVEWMVSDGGGVEAGGHVTVTNLPASMTFGVTYSVSFSFVVEWLDWGSSIRPQTVDWFAKAGCLEESFGVCVRNSQNITLGGSTVDGSFARNEVFSVTASLSLADRPDVDGTLASLGVRIGAVVECLDSSICAPLGGTNPAQEFSFLRPESSVSFSLLSSLVSSNIIRNHSFEDGVNPLTGYPPEWGNWTKHGTPDSTITVDDTRAVDGNYSARLDVGEKVIGFIALYQTLPPALRFGNLSDRPDGLDFWFYLEPKYDGLGDFRVRILLAENVAELNYVFDPDPSLAYPNITDSSGNPLAVSIFLNGYSAGVWHHFQRNLRADWQASGFSLDTPFPRIQFDALTFRNTGNGQSFAEIVWVDNVKLYTDAPATDPPTWPAGSSLTVIQVGTTSVGLIWTSAQDDMGVVAYRILQDNAAIATVGRETLSYNVGGLSPGTSYIFKVEAGDAEGNWTTDGPSITVTIEPEPALPMVGVWNDAYFSSNVTDTSLTPPGQITFQVNVTGAPSFNAFEFFLYYDPAVIRAVSTDTTGTMCHGQTPPFKDENLATLGTIRVVVVKLGGACSGTDGTLIHINFNILSVGVSPLALAEGIARVTVQQSWTRLALLDIPIAVDTSDGYFKNVAGKSGPVAEFAFIPTEPEQGDTVVFDAQASFDPDSDLGPTRGIAEYIWDFGDGLTVSGVTTPTTQHVFESLSGHQFLGNFSVRLTVVDSDGFQGMKTMIVEVSQQQLHDIQVFSLTINPDTVVRGEDVTISVIVRNVGTVSEAFTLVVRVLAPSIPIANTTGQILPNESRSFQFTLNTSSLMRGFALIEAFIPEMDDVPDNNRLVNIIQIREPQRAHDLAITDVFTNTQVAVSGQVVRITVEVSNRGLNAETFDVTAYYDSQIAGTVTGVQIPAPSIVVRSTTVFVTITWNTIGVAPGTYSMSATAFLAADENPSDNTLTDGQVRIDPPPTIAVSPSSGSVGTRTTVDGSGFPLPFPAQQFAVLSVSFDGVSVGSVFSTDGTFSFTFNVPHSQPGLHQIKAFDSLSEVGTVASFLVLPSSGLEVTVRVGEIYFRGDTVDIYVLASIEGSLVENSELQIELSLIRPDGSTVVLQASSVSAGLFKAAYQVPANGAFGTYTVTARAHHTNTLEESTLRSFEVKPSWLQVQGPRIASAAAVAGLAAIGAVAWRRGYIGRRRPPSATSSPKRSGNALPGSGVLPP